MKGNLFSALASDSSSGDEKIVIQKPIAFKKARRNKKNSKKKNNSPFKIPVIKETPLSNFTFTPEGMSWADWDDVIGQLDERYCPVCLATDCKIKETR
jgi:hypothetical protein